MLKYGSLNSLGVRERSLFAIISRGLRRKAAKNADFRWLKLEIEFLMKNQETVTTFSDSELHSIENAQDFNLNSGEPHLMRLIVWKQDQTILQVDEKHYSC